MSSKLDSLPRKVAVKKLFGNVDKVYENITYMKNDKNTKYCNKYFIIHKDEQLRREVYFLEKSNHPNIVKYYGYFHIDDKSTGIVMESPFVIKTF